MPSNSRAAETLPPTPAFAGDEARWDAVRRRDAAADGAFLYAVRTTGVYCRPSCAARLPNRENVCFFDDADAAERAGFRPCKRCRPRDADLATRPLADRIAALDWSGLADDLDAHGCATTPSLLTAAECAALAGLYDDEAPFRSRVVMARHGFGQGEYRYFAYPLPTAVAELRTALYPPLAEIANRWNARLGVDTRYPDTHRDYLDRCHAAGQTRPTPLLLRYGPGDYNCLHQDLYGEHVFPLQAAILLSRPGRDFTGGEFVLTEQRPRRQSRAEVVSLAQGEAVILPVHHRPVEGARGPYRVTMRHGVSRLRAGRRHTLGVIFHDAR